MPRRRNRQTPGPTAEQALAASVAANRELRAELDAAEKRLTDADKAHAATQRQLNFQRDEAREARADLAAQITHTEQLERRVGSLAYRLKLERDHTAGSCSHAAELRAMGVQVSALERRVAELQRINQGYDALGMVSQPEPEQAAKKWRVL